MGISNLNNTSEEYLCNSSKISNLFNETDNNDTEALIASSLDTKDPQCKKTYTFEDEVKELQSKLDQENSSKSNVQKAGEKRKLIEITDPDSNPSISQLQSDLGHPEPTLTKVVPETRRDLQDNDLASWKCPTSDSSTIFPGQFFGSLDTSTQRDELPTLFDDSFPIPKSNGIESAILNDKVEELPVKLDLKKHSDLVTWKPAKNDKLKESSNVIVGENHSQPQYSLQDVPQMKITRLVPLTKKGLKKINHPSSQHTPLESSTMVQSPGLDFTDTLNMESKTGKSTSVKQFPTQNLVTHKRKPIILKPSSHNKLIKIIPQNYPEHNFDNKKMKFGKENSPTTTSRKEPELEDY